MNKAALEKEIFFEKANNSKIITGYVILKSSETILIDRIKGIIFLEVRGRMSSSKEEVLALEIEQNRTLLKNEYNKISFSFDSSNFDINTYYGKNVNFAYIIEIQIDVNENDRHTIERNFLSKAKSLVTSDHSIKVAEYFDVKKIDQRYQVAEETIDFSTQFKIILTIVMAILFAIAYIAIVPNLSFWYVLMGFFSFFIIKSLTMQQVLKALDVVAMQTIKDHDGFICQIFNKSKLSLKNPSLYYEILEQVVDTRGTTSFTYNETLYTSEEHKISNFYMNPSFRFSFPQIEGLHSFKYNNASILWQMNLKGKIMGFNLKYTCTFHVLSV